MLPLVLGASVCLLRSACLWLSPCCFFRFKKNRILYCLLKSDFHSLLRSANVAPWRCYFSACLFWRFQSFVYVCFVCRCVCVYVFVKSCEIDTTQKSKESRYYVKKNCLENGFMWTTITICLLVFFFFLFLLCAHNILTALRINIKLR